MKWRYLKGMADNPAGWIILCNLLDGFDLQLFAKDFLTALILCWMREFDRGIKAAKKKTLLFKPPTKEERLWDSFAAVCGDSGSGLSCPGVRFHCKRILKPPLDKYASIADARDFVEERMEPTEKARLSGKGWLTCLLDPSPVNWDSWRPVGKLRVHLAPVGPGGAKATIGHPAKMLWITPQSAILPSLNQPHPADDLRDIFGLIRLHDCPLLAMSLPGAAVDRQEHARPTVADAGNHRRYMAKSSRSASDPSSPWGQTVELARFARGESDIDGLPERIVRPIPVEFLPELEIQPLGLCGPGRGVSKMDNDEAFAKMLCAKHGGPAAMMERIRDLLQ